MKFLLEHNGLGAFVEMQRDDSSDYYGEVQDAFLRFCGVRDTRREGCAMIRVDDMETAAGVPFIWGLANADGAYFELLAMPGTTAEQIKAAKHKLRNDRDVVSLSVRRISEIVPFTQPAREVVA